MIYQASSAFITLVYVFIADAHLKIGHDVHTERFLSLIRSVGPHAERIYLLGDLFDYWYTGMESLVPEVMEVLRDPKILIVPGNRDFLLRNCRDRHIAVSKTEELRITVHGTKLLIAHGHTLTQGDYGFKFIHASAWPLLKVLDRVLPPRFKDTCARFFVSSSASVRPPRAEIDPGTASRIGVEMVVCGHLHRCIVNEDLMVLPAFFDSGSWLSWDRTGPRFRSLGEVTALTS